MVTALLVLAGFILGAGCAVYCLRLGMMWAQAKAVPGEEARLPLSPFTKPPPEGDAKEQDRALQNWFLGGEDE